MGRILKIYRDGRKHERLLKREIPGKAQGNFETLSIMKEIVLSDSKEQDLANFVKREIIGSDNRFLKSQIDAVFTYARDQIIYEQEKDGFETVADLWSCLYALHPDHATGDCAIKSIFIATCLSYLGLKPAFVAIQQIPNADYFNHVFVEVEANGELIPLDATPLDFQPGDELESHSRLVYRIFQ